MADQAPPPPGTGQPNVNRGPEILAVSGALVAFSAIFVVLRFYVRTRITKNVSWDDWTVLGSWIIVFVELMIFIPQVQYGAGKHAAYIDPPSDISKGLKLNFITQPLCMLAITLVKISIGLFLLRLTPTVIHRRIIQVTVALTIAANFAYIVILFNQCRPLPALWGEGKGTCMTGAQLRFATFFNACFGILTDLILALIPIPMLYKLQMNWKVKLAVCGVLSLGLFAASAAAVKVYFTENFGKKGDFLWDATDLTIWTTVEICVAIIACSIPTLKKLFKSSFRGSSLGNTYPNQSRSGYMQHMSSSKKRTNPSTNRSNISEPDFEMYTKSKKPEVTISGPRRKDKLDPDNISEESFIQHDQTRDANGTIRKTVQVYQV